MLSAGPYLDVSDSFEKGKSIEEFVLESINNQILLESEQEYANSLSQKTSLLLKDLWDNDKDAAYDKL